MKIKSALFIFFNRPVLSIFLLAIGFFWNFLNIFYLPFLIWTEGINRPWLMLNNFILYKDLAWNRMPLDLYFLAGFYKIFGIDPLNFQIFIFLLYFFIGIIIFLLLLKKSFSLAVVSYIFYSIFSIILYSTHQPGEILVSLFVFLSFYFFWKFTERESLLFLFLTGVFSGLSFITKQTSAGIIIAITLSLLIFYFKKGFFNKIFLYCLSALIPLIVLSLYYGSIGALYDFYYNNFYFGIITYGGSAPLWGLREGIQILIFHLSIIIPFIFTKTNKYISIENKTILILIILSLFPSILPSFWSYRLITALPLFSVMTAIFFLNIFKIIANQKKLFKKTAYVFSIIFFLILFNFYYNQYSQFLRNIGGFNPRSYSLDAFGDNEKNVVSWLKNNTMKNERVFNTSNNLIMFYGNRFPHNKYDCSMCLAFYPLEDSFNKITKNPPRVVIYANTITTDWAVLKEWKFIEYLKKYYSLKETFGTNEIYVRR